jgi:hypothetical protein
MRLADSRGPIYRSLRVATHLRLIRFGHPSSLAGARPPYRTVRLDICNTPDENVRSFHTFTAGLLASARLVPTDRAGRFRPSTTAVISLC